MPDDTMFIETSAGNIIGEVTSIIFDENTAVFEIKMNIDSVEPARKLFVAPPVVISLEMNSDSLSSGRIAKHTTVYAHPLAHKLGFSESEKTLTGDES